MARYAFTDLYQGEAVSLSVSGEWELGIIRCLFQVSATADEQGLCFSCVYMGHGLGLRHGRECWLVASAS